MRERLVAAFVGLTIVVIALYGIPRAYYLADLVRSQEQARVDRAADLVAAVVDERQAAGRPVDVPLLDGLADDGESIVVVEGDGATTHSSADTGDPVGDVTSTASLSGGGTVTVTRDGRSVSSEVGRALLPLALLGLLIAVVAGYAGVLLANRLSRPYRTLETGLASSTKRLESLVEHERELVVHASHELRTPVTALRLALEDLSLWPETTPAVAAELRRSVGELDRLAGVVDDLLATSRDLSAAAEIDLDLDALVAHAAGQRSVVHHRTGALPTRLDPAPVVEALQALLDDGTEVAAADRGTHLEVTISGYAAPPLLDRATDLVAAAGGQLAYADGTAVLRLPKRPLREPGRLDSPAG